LTQDAMKREIPFLAVVIVTAFTLRVVNLESIPRWDWDEGANLDIAMNLMDGRSRLFAMEYLWLPHPPLYYAVASSLMGAGDGILALRVLSLCTSVATTVVIYLIGREFGGARTGFASSMAYAVYPEAVYWGRMGFANNMLAFEAALMMLLALVYARGRRKTHLYAACLVGGLSVLTEYAGLVFLCALVLYVVAYDRRSLVACVCVCLAIPVFFLSYMLLAHGQVFADELVYQMSRFKVGLALAAAVLAVVFSRQLKAVSRWLMSESVGVDFPAACMYFPFTLLLILLPLDDNGFLISLVGFYPIASMLGLRLVEAGERRALMWVFYVCALTIPFGYGRADHMVIPVYPMYSIALGVFISGLYGSAYAYLLPKAKHVFVASIAALLVAYYPFLYCLVQDWGLFVEGRVIYRMPLDAMERLCGFVSSHARGGDLVIAPSYLTGCGPSLKGIIEQAVVYDGGAFRDIRPLPRERFAYNTSVLNARYIIGPRASLDGFVKSYPLLRASMAGMVENEELAGDLGSLGYVVYEWRL